MLDDFRRGKPPEHEYLNGNVVWLGQENHIPAPHHSVFDTALKPASDRLAGPGVCEFQRVWVAEGWQYGGGT